MQYLCIFYLSLVVEGGSSLMDEAVVAQEDRFNNISWLDVPFRAYSFGLQKNIILQSVPYSLPDRLI